MRVLVAPDKFKEALDAPAVAAALAAGVREACPDADVVECPLADGGDGTGGILAGALAAEMRRAEVLDPLGRPCAARWWYVADQNLAIIEMAEASGLHRLRPAERDPLWTTSYGTGQLIAAALAQGVTRVHLCVGGSATVDGGAACLQALGWTAYRIDGRAIEEPLSGGRLAEVARLEPPVNAPRPSVDVLVDVRNPLLGPRGAAAVFAPQKGADAAAVAELEEQLAAWNHVLEDVAGFAVSTHPGSGAAGGIPAALRAAFCARVVPGFDVVAEHTRLTEQLAAADVCLTGEGRLDAQTSQGKVVAGVAQRAADVGKPTLALVGAAEGTPDELARALGLIEVIVITPPNTSLETALARTGENLRAAALQRMRNWRVP